jgi:4-hydroxybenzoate polyprenyltransferase
MKKILDYIFFTRPVLFPPVWTILILGARAATAGEGGSPLTTSGLHGLDWIFLGLILSVSALYGGVYTFNQIYDIESDRRNSKLFYLAEGMISKQAAMVYSVLLFAAGTAGCFSVNRRIGLLSIAVLLLGVLYSLPITNFKGKPSHGYWSNVIGHGMLPFVIGWAFLDHVTLEAVFKSTPYIFGVGAIYLNTTLPDREGDKATGKITHGVRWGVSSTMKASVFLVVFSCILAQMCGDFAFLIGGLVSLPFFYAAMKSEKMKQIVLSTKISIIALTVFACVFYPFYAAILIVGFVAARFYYKARFGLSYPSVS